MAKKQVITQAQAETIVGNVQDAVESLRDIRDQISKLNAEDFKENGIGIARSLAAMARLCSDTAVTVIAHCELSAQRRQLETLTRQQN